jgi:hypothetical protein
MTFLDLWAAAARIKYALLNLFKGVLRLRANGCKHNLTP